MFFDKHHCFAQVVQANLAMLCDVSTMIYISHCNLGWVFESKTVRYLVGALYQENKTSCASNEDINKWKKSKHPNVSVGTPLKTDRCHQLTSQRWPLLACVSCLSKESYICKHPGSTSCAPKMFWNFWEDKLPCLYAVTAAALYRALQSRSAASLRI